MPSQLVLLPLKRAHDQCGAASKLINSFRYRSAHCQQPVQSRTSSAWSFSTLTAQVTVMEPSNPRDISGQMRRGSLDSNIGRRDSMESSGSMRDSRSSSFEGGNSVDEARLQVWKAHRAKKAWAEPDASTAFWSA